MQVWNLLQPARDSMKIHDAKMMQKLAICAPSHKFVALHFRNKACIDNRKKSLLNSNISSTCSHNMVNFRTLTAANGWDRLASLGHPSKFQRVSRFGFVTAPTSLNGGQPNFARCLAVSWADTGAEFCQMQNSLCVSKFCVLLYWQRYCTHASAKLCGVVQGMELRNFRFSSFWLPP